MLRNRCARNNIVVGCLSALELALANRNSYPDRYADTNPNPDDRLVPPVNDSYAVSISNLHRDT